MKHYQELKLLKYFHTHGIISNDQISIMGPSGGDMAMLGDAAETLNLKFGKINKQIKNDLKSKSSRCCDLKSLLICRHIIGMILII